MKIKIGLGLTVLAAVTFVISKQTNFADLRDSLHISRGNNKSFLDGDTSGVEIRTSRGALKSDTHLRVYSSK